jgi:16S rRNA (uracil1498-N3)-methyltransferase
MTIDEPMTWHDFVGSTASRYQKLVMHTPDDNSVPKPIEIDLLMRNQGIVAAVGPEGGFTDQEIQLAVAAGWTIVSWGPRILRVETAAVAMAAWISGLSSPAWAVFRKQP